MKKLAIYTSIKQGYEELLPQPVLKGADFICFTDTPLRQKPWKTVLVSPPALDATRQNRYYKLHPHVYLPQYEASIYIDGNVVVQNDVVDWAWQLLARKPMWAFDHKQSGADGRGCLYEEYEALLALYAQGIRKDDPQVMERQITRYRTEGYPEQQGLTYNMVLLRRHHDPLVKKTMQLWWNEVQTGSRRDQLSFNYVCWKTGLEVGIVPGDVRRHTHFHMVGKHTHNHKLNYMRYRLKRLLRMA
jgi:hypothetical protein